MDANNYIASSPQIFYKTEGYLFKAILAESINSIIYIQVLDA